jgi:hypothetical protein
MVEHYSNKIQNVIQKELFNAKQSIRIVVAWFTNDLLFQPLVLKQQAGVKVEIILNRDEINDSEENGIDFNELVNVGGIVRWNETKQLMHDKFCIIDDSIVIYGSYNWTNKAEYNEESIAVSRNEPETIKFYLEKFKKLAEKYPSANKSSAQNTTDIIASNQKSEKDFYSFEDINALLQERSQRRYIGLTIESVKDYLGSGLRFYNKIGIISLSKDRNSPEKDFIIAKSSGVYNFISLQDFKPINKVEFIEYRTWTNNSNGNIIWLNADGRNWGLYDACQERFLLAPIFDDVKPFGGQIYSAVKLKNKWGLVDAYGNLILECKYTSIGDGSDEKGDRCIFVFYNGNYMKFENGKLQLYEFPKRTGQFYL